MTAIKLTHGGQRLDLSEHEAVSLHNALTQALDAAGIDPLKHSTLKAPNGVQTFQRGDQRASILTDC
ncbi:hypothetical protein [Halomonas sp. JS92-SW72]|jgi:hypothetical protein|uniref:hypothetical protein n=1 Tax=Halomonas sp. JS92-SW72 TaxID=2306583 RepID=UPI000E5BA161|nr:hypothetical protein [Halomonas sp. JS92-SW72]AXY43916.1 hypothetical protein D1793_17930 [Halomonas sp. JS92-SW72]